MRPIPSSVHEELSLLHLVGYYQGFIKKILDITFQLNLHLKNKIKFCWTKKCKKAFKKVKVILVEHSEMAYPNSSLPSKMHMSTSDTGLGAVLAQKRRR